MEKQFVTYSIALKLKELGFDEPCLGFFTHLGEIRRYTNLVGDSIGCVNQFQNVKNSDISLGENWCSSPLWQEVMDWFREKHDIHMSVNPLYNPKKFNTLMYSYDISYKENYYGGLDDNLDAWIGLSDDGINYHICTSYEEAREQAILKAIELIRTDKK